MGKIKTLTRQQRKHVDKAFRSFAGNDLLIDYGEWKQALGLKNDALVRRIFDLVDEDGTGFIDGEEFLAFAAQLSSENPKRRLEFIFRIYDLDEDGSLDKNELRRVLEASLAEQSMTLPDDVLKNMTARLLGRADRDKDGRVSREEFVETLSDYPGIEEQFSVYAADWLNEGQGFRSKRLKPAPLRVRLRRLWEARRPSWFWATAYLAANASLFALAMDRYAAQGAGLDIQLARGAGACLNLNGALLLVPVCRSFWTWVRKTRMERFFALDDMTGVHRWLGSAVILFSALHIGGHSVHLFQRSGLSAAAALLRPGWGLTGLATAVLLAVMAVFSVRFRRGRRETFLAVHLLYGAWLAVLLFHAPYFWAWLTPPAALFLADALVRWALKTRPVTILEMKALSNGVTWVRFKKPKGFVFQPGDYLYLNVPAVSSRQWHPFTISAAPEASELAVHVRINGDWTGALHNLSRKKTSAGRTWPARIDGPYGAPSSRILRSPLAVMVAAGIGVTPFASVLQSLLLRRREGRTPAGQTIHFHWLNRSHRSYEWFVDLLKEAEKTLGEERFRLHIHLTSLTHDLTNIAMQLAMDAYRDRHERDPLTGLAAETSAGRPDWDHVFGTLASERPGERADVFFCGPPALGAAVRRNARRHGMVYHEERF